MAAVSVAWLAALALLGTLALQDASAVWLTAVELPMLALSVLWFWLAVARVAPDRPSP